jgi:putative MATE family efflux protein
VQGVLRSRVQVQTKDATAKAIPTDPEFLPGTFPKFDTLDKTILILSVPAIVNFMLVPLVGAADTFWVGKMCNAAALAGTGAANQMYSTTFWVLGFLPSVITPLVAQAYGAKDMEGVQRHIGEALFLSLIIGMLGCALVTFQSQALLKIVIPAGAPAMAFAVPYFLCRGIGFLPAMLSTVGFATFRGTLDTVTPLAGSAFANIFHIVLLPLLIFNAGLGVVGAGIATVVSDILSSAAYLTLLFRRGFVNMSSIFRVPNWSHIADLLKAGFAVQLRTVAMNAVFIAGAGNIQAMDLTGTAAAAHTITTNFWSLGGTVLLALSTVAAILVPRRSGRRQQSLKRALIAP